jgi:ATP-binding cassette subfamily F protein 3
MDMDSREALEDAIGQFEGTVVMVSHDRYLIDKLATRILELKPHPAFGGDLLDYRVSKVGSGYTEFSEYKQARIAERESAGAAVVSESVRITSNKEQYLRQKQEAADARKKKAKRERLEKECAELEKRLEQIEEELFGDAASDYVRAAELDAEKTQAEERLLEIYEELEGLE